MAVVAYGRCIPEHLVLMAFGALCNTVLTLKLIACIAAMIKESVPGILVMALGAVHSAELVHVRVAVALVAIAVYLFVCALCLMAGLAQDIIVHALKLVACLSLVVKLPRLPVKLRMAGIALFLELALMHILMAVGALLRVCLISLILVALIALGVPVPSYKRELGLLVMVERALFPVKGRVAF